jgi:hypothetical protein
VVDAAEPAGLDEALRERHGRRAPVVVADRVRDARARHRVAHARGVRDRVR